MEHYLEWHKENVKEVISSEQTLVHKDGYGGTTDLLCVLKDGSRAIVDYKTQGVRRTQNRASMIAGFTNW